MNNAENRKRLREMIALPPEEMDYYEPHVPSIKEDELAAARIKLLGELAGHKFYMVDGSYIRKNIDIDFVMGGNFARDRYVPECEIWIDSIVPDNEIAFVLAHEYVEQMLMVQHSLSYEGAHDRASAMEQEYRKSYVYSGDAFKDFLEWIKAKSL